jgi:DNA-binding HxlR family transcriptional regulator
LKKQVKIKSSPRPAVEKRTVKRFYGDGCAMAHGLDLVGERWTLLVMRELLLGPKRFSDLRASLPGISANVLTQRLEALEAAGIAVRRRLPPPASAWVYELTEWGLESEDVFKTMGRWAARSPLHDPRSPLSVASVVMSMRTMFAPERARGVSGTIGFRFGREEFVARVKNQGGNQVGKGIFTIEREPITDADVTVSGDRNAWAGALYGGVPLKDLESAGALTITGDRALLTRVMTLFPLPAKAAAGSAVDETAR